jgi:EAL domain-containing protein (putative c-di-GMP-specific phosphodiesterase class I)
VPPGEFVPLAEQSGLIVPLTYWVVETAATDYAHWAAQGRPFPISINLATPVLAEVGVADQLKARFAVEGVPCHEVTLEISESGLLNQRARDGVSACAAAGFRLAIDDFGTGYASFSYLKDVDVDVVKIDRSFVRNLHTDERDVAIVGSIAFVTRRLGLRTVAEGVESEQALELLDELGIDEAQGFLFSPALPVDDLDLWRAGWTSSQQAHRQRRGVSQPESRQ